MKPYVYDVIGLLEDNIGVLVYAGDGISNINLADFICNWMGNKAWTQKLKWSGQTNFQNAKEQVMVNLY